MTEFLMLFLNFQVKYVTLALALAKVLYVCYRSVIEFTER